MGHDEITDSTRLANGLIVAGDGNGNYQLFRPAFDLPWCDEFFEVGSFPTYEQAVQEGVSHG